MVQNGLMPRILLMVEAAKSRQLGLSPSQQELSQNTEDTMLDGFKSFGLRNGTTNGAV